MTETPDWPHLGEVTLAQLGDTRRQIHHAVQALAAFGQTFVAERPDDSHRSVQWNVDGQCFWSQPAEDGTRVALSFEPLELQVVSEDKPGRSLKLMGTTLRTLRAWLEESVPAVTGWPAQEIAWPEYDLPEHRVQDGVPFEPLPRAQQSLAAWYTRGSALVRHIADTWDDASEIQTWPHHFDLASLLTLESGDDASSDRTIGVGMSPGDGHYGEPYFYVMPWPYPDPEHLHEFEGPGYWHTKNWVGLVLTASALAELGNADQQRDAARSFMSRAVEAARAELSGR